MIVGIFRLKDVEMFWFKAIDESEYELDDQYCHVWKYKRRVPVRENEKDNGNVFVYKNDFVNNDVYFGEVVGSCIARSTIENGCRAELAKKSRGIAFDNGVISFYYFAEKDEPIAPYNVLTDYCAKEKMERVNFPAVDLILKALADYIVKKNGRPYAEFEAVKQQYVDMVMFDCKFGNYDRGIENWLLYRDGKSKEIKLYPLFDNEAVLGFDAKPTCDFQEMIAYCQRQDMKYYVSSSDNFRHSKMEDVEKYFLRNYPKEAKIAVEKVNRYSMKDLNALLNQFPDMGEERKAFTLRMFATRDYLFSKYQEEILMEKEMDEGRE